MAARSLIGRAGALLGGPSAGVVLAGLALALRLLHALTTAKLLLADDAVFFEQHARTFLDAWLAIGRPEFGSLLREAVDGASLQGVVYPFSLSLIYLVAGGVNHHATAMVQAVMGAASVWLLFSTTRRAFGQTAALAAGVLAAVYAPFVLASGVLLAEATLLLIQALAAWLLVAGLDRGAWRARLLAGASVGLLMLRPAFQYAGLLSIGGLVAAAFVQGRRPADLARLAAPVVVGIGLIAVPWLLVNGLVFGQPVWSRTGDAWQQVYWGIYPPNRGWWPPDSPVPPKYGVESLPGARAAGRQIEVRDLDYLEAALQQIEATPLQALATEVNKLYQAYLHPFNTYAEAPVLVTGPAEPLHRALLWLALLGSVVAAGRPSALAQYGLGAGVALPFLVSHIDLRYVIPIAFSVLPFAGLGVSALFQRWRSAPGPLVTAGAVFAAWGLSEPVLLWGVPSLAPLDAHRLHSAVMCVALCAGCVLVGHWAQAGAGKGARHLRVPLVWLVALVVSAAYGVQARYDGDWHEWSTVLRPGDAATQRIVLPVGWTMPPGARAEVRLYAAGASEQSYVPIVSANGREVARLGPAFIEGGPLRFEERIMVTASQQGKVRADVPQWYGVPLDSTALAGGSVELRLSIEGAAGAWLRLWGDYPSEPGRRVLEAPSIYSRIQGQDDSFHKFVATGHPRLWRRFPLASSEARARLEVAGGALNDDLSASPGRQSGEFRMRVLVLGSAGDLLALL